MPIGLSDSPVIRPSSVAVMPRRVPSRYIASSTAMVSAMVGVPRKVSTDCSAAAFGQGDGAERRAQDQHHRHRDETRDQAERRRAGAHRGAGLHRGRRCRRSVGSLSGRSSGLLARLSRRRTRRAPRRAPACRSSEPHHTPADQPGRDAAGQTHDDDPAEVDVQQPGRGDGAGVRRQERVRHGQAGEHRHRVAAPATCRRAWPPRRPAGRARRCRCRRTPGCRARGRSGPSPAARPSGPNSFSSRVAARRRRRTVP